VENGAELGTEKTAELKTKNKDTPPKRAVEERIAVEDETCETTD
jgi:hypothetical protein